MEKLINIEARESLTEFFDIMRDLIDEKDIKVKNAEKLENLFSAFRKFDMSIDLTEDLYTTEQIKQYKHTRELLINYLSRLPIIFNNK